MCKHSFAEKVFFTNSGAESIECGLKVIRSFHHYNKNLVTLNPSRIFYNPSPFLCESLTTISNDFYKIADSTPELLWQTNPKDKLKFDNLKILASNNKFILTFVALFFLFVSYLLVPTFYKQGDISKELKKELLNKFNLQFSFAQNLNYNFFPRPHFVSSESSILENQNKIADIDKLKIYVSLDYLFSLKNININEVILENTNFELNIKNSNFFVKLLDNNFLDANLNIKNSNIFFRDSENEILFINIIKNLKYYYDPNELKNILYSENEIFNTPFSLKVINHKDETKLYTKLDLDFAKLQIENIFNYKDDIKSGAATILFNTDKSLINYKTNKNFFEFNYSNELESKKFLYNGIFFNFAESFFTAIETAKIALAPKLFFCLVPSSLINIESISS